MKGFKGRLRNCERRRRSFLPIPNNRLTPFRAAAMEGSRQRVALARMAVEETGMGVLEVKVMKNQYAAEFVYHKYRDYKTCGVVEEDTAYGIRKIAEPIGVIGAVTQ